MCLIRNSIYIFDVANSHQTQKPRLHTRTLSFEWASLELAYQHYVVAINHIHLIHGDVNIYQPITSHQTPIYQHYFNVVSCHMKSLSRAYLLFLYTTTYLPTYRTTTELNFLNQLRLIISTLVAHHTIDNFQRVTNTTKSRAWVANDCNYSHYNNHLEAYKLLITQLYTDYNVLKKSIIFLIKMNVNWKSRENCVVSLSFFHSEAGKKQFIVHKQEKIVMSCRVLSIIFQFLQHQQNKITVKTPGFRDLYS